MTRPNLDVPDRIRLDKPFEHNNVLVIQPAGINVEPLLESSPDAYFSVLAVGDGWIINLSVSHPGNVTCCSHGVEAQVTKPLKDIFPSEAEHSLIFYWRGGRLRLLCDLQSTDLSLATVLPAPGVTLECHLGIGSPFIGPITATVYPNIADFVSQSPLYTQRFPEMDKEALFLQLCNFDVAHARGLSDALATIREANQLFDVTPTCPLNAHSTVYSIRLPGSFTSPVPSARELRTLPSALTAPVVFLASVSAQYR